MAPYRPAPSTTRKTQYRTPYSPIKPYKRSPLQYNRNRPGPRRSAPPESHRISNNWYQRPPILDPIYESPPNRRRQEVLFDFEDSFRVPEEREEDDDDEDDVPFPWEDEQTLIDELSRDGRAEPDDDEVLKLIDSLQTSFTRYSNTLVDDIAQTLVPAVRRVKEAHHILNTRVDEDFGKGLWEFHDACKKIEVAMLKDADEVKEEYEAAQVRIADIMAKLEDAYARRDQLWVDFEVKFNGIVDPTIDMLKDLPVRMERAISEVDKQSKKLNKDDVGPEQTLKDLLTKLT